MVIVVADENGKALRELADFDFEIAFGEDENTISFTADADNMPPNGGYVFIDGTEYGGTIDETKASISQSEGKTLNSTGRSWHGVLAGKRLLPDAGNSHLVVSGQVANILQQLITRMGLENLFEAPAEESDNVSISQYQFERFVDGYTGLKAMCLASGLKLKMRFISGKVLLGARAVVDYGSKVDSDLIDFDITKITRRTNHLVCGGTGENENRAIVHFFADSNGVVSKTQSLFGVDEIAAFYDYSNAEEEELEEDGKKKLEEMQGQGTVEVNVHEDLDIDVGDIVSARDNKNGILVSASIVKKIVKISGGVTSYEYEAGTPSTGTSASTISGSAESSGGGHAYYAGTGLSLDNYTFNAEVTSADLSAVDTKANNAILQASNAASEAATAHEAAEAAQSTANSKAPLKHTHAKIDIIDFPESMPASDVYSWAKEPSKPSYSYEEVGAAPTQHTHNYAASSTAGGSAIEAEKLSSPRIIKLTGAVSGQASFDGSQNIEIVTDGDDTAASFLAAHPVGSLYETTISDNPATIYGGTWEALPSVGAFIWERKA